MRPRPGTAIAGLALVAAAAGAAASDLATTRAGDARSLAFHAVTGGLGTGPATSRAGCAGAFDERETDLCPDHFEPVPCGDALCPHTGPAPGAAR